MGSKTNSSTPGPNSYGFSTGQDPTASQMPSTLGGAAGSYSNLTGTGTAGDSGYQTMSPTMFTDSSGAGGMTPTQLQGVLGGASTIAQQGASRQQMPMRAGGVRLPAETFSSGVTGAPVVGGSNTVQSLLALMQQRKG